MNTKTKMIATAMGLSALLSTGVASAAPTAHDPYYAAFYGMSAPMTPPRGEAKMRMKGKAGYGEPTEVKPRYGKVILTGKNRNEMNRVATPVTGGGAYGSIDGHTRYDRAFNPN